MAIIEVPTAIQQVNDEFKIAKKKKKYVEPKTFWDIWGGAIVSAAATIGFMFLHWINFEFFPLLYFGLFSFVTVPVIMNTIRGVVVDYPQYQFSRYFSIFYECVFVKSFFRNNFVLCVFCFLGYFINVEYFSIELLEVVSISPVIADIVRSIVTPGKALLLVFYLFCVTTFIWASFGMTSFHSSLRVPVLNEDGSTGEKHCGHTIQCFYYIFHEALSDHGKMRRVLAPAYVGSTEFPTRIIYDVVYVIWVGIILLNVITGLMVDTFTSIREEKQSRASTLANDCFVCGISRQNYEDLSLGHEAPTFDKHIAEEHNPWIYLNYISYLKKKDPTTDSGIESFVRKQLDDQLTDWIPKKTSYYIDTKERANN